MIKVLNLYAGIGGNRKLWKNVDVVAVENNPKIAKVYLEFFPDDVVVVKDAHKFLLNHYKEYDFIWSSPPCPSHSRVRKANINQNKPIFPSMKLYEEILFLEGYFKGKWIVENVISWYDPLIKPYQVGTHYFWSNFVVPKMNVEHGHHDGNIEELSKRKGFDVEGKDLGHRKNQVLRNCVEPELGLHVFNCGFKDKQRTLL